MPLSIKYQKVFGIPVAPDAISSGSVSLTSYPAITGDFVTTVNINLKTYTFNLQGINEEQANTLIGYCDANAEELAKGNIDLTNPVGQGSFTYGNKTLVPIAYEDGGTLNIANTTNNYSSFNITCLSDTVVASI